MGGKTDMTSVMDRFKKLYDTNDPKKGGSFYIQSVRLPLLHPPLTAAAEALPPQSMMISNRSIESTASKRKNRDGGEGR